MKNVVSENDEPLLSGSGIVSKEVTDENLLEAWHEALTKWHQNLKQRPKAVSSNIHTSMILKVNQDPKIVIRKKS